MRLDWLLDRLFGLAVAVWASKVGRMWWDKHPPRRRRGGLPDWQTFALGIAIRLGLTTAFSGLDRRLRWKRRLSRVGVVRYMLFRTAWWTLLRAWGIRQERRRLIASERTTADSA